MSFRSGSMSAETFSSSPAALSRRWSPNGPSTTLAPLFLAGERPLHVLDRLHDHAAALDNPVSHLKVDDEAFEFPALPEVPPVAHDPFASSEGVSDLARRAGVHIRPVENRYDDPGAFQGLAIITAHSPANLLQRLDSFRVRHLLRFFDVARPVRSILPWIVDLVTFRPQCLPELFQVAPRGIGEAVGGGEVDNRHGGESGDGYLVPPSAFVKEDVWPSMVASRGDDLVSIAPPPGGAFISGHVRQSEPAMP